MSNSISHFQHRYIVTSTIDARVLTNLSLEIARWFYAKYRILPSRLQLPQLRDEGISLTLLDDQGAAVGFIQVQNSLWDTNHFGFKIGKLRILAFKASVPPSVRLRLIHNMLERARKEGLQLIIARIPLDDTQSIITLERTGFCQYDTLVTLKLDLTVKQSSAKEGVTIRSASAEDLGELSELVKSSSWHSHFHSDPRIPREKADQLYVKWIGENLSSPNSVVMVANVSGKIVGFVSGSISRLGVDLSAATIDLIAVDPNYRNKGIGSALMSEIIRWFLARTQLVFIGTQGSNIDALRLYTKLGFRPTSFEVTFHKWLRTKRQK